MLTEGDPIPDAPIQMGDGTTMRLPQLARPLVLYFYPKDDTSGCTAEAQDFSARLAAFTTAGVGVLGVSRNNPAEHDRFIAKHALTVPLATDPNGELCEAFGTWVEKSMYGRKYMGIDRATFLLGGDGRVARVWRRVKVPGHVDEVLAAASALPPA